MDTSNHTMHNSYMQFNDPSSSNADFNNFINGVHLAAADNLDGDSQFDPALFEGTDLSASYTNRPQTATPASAYTQRAQPSHQSQSPALPQFNPSVPTYPGQQFGPHGIPQSIHDQRSLASPFDTSLLSRPTPSPGPYEQYPFRQTSSYSHPQQTTFDPRFNNFSNQGRSQSPTPLQAFRGQTSQNVNQIGSLQHGQPNQYMHPQGPQSLKYPYPAHNSINPNMLASNGAYAGLQTLAQARHEGPASYFNPASMGMDPRLLQHPMYATQRQGQGQAQTAAGPPQSLSQAFLPGQYPGQVQGPVRPQIVNAAAAPPMKLQPRKSNSHGPGSPMHTDDELEIEDEEPEVKPALLSIAKPTDERGKLLWEVMDAVWTPRNKPADPEKVRSGIKFVGDNVRMLRDKWKAQNERLKQAELPSSHTAAGVDTLKAATTNSRELMETLVIRITRFGHPSILRRLGENQFTLSALYSFLLDRVNAEDYDSKLITAILELGTHLETVDEEQLEKVKWSKVLTRISKKSTTTSKASALKILENAKQATLRKKNGATTTLPPASSVASANGHTVGSVAGVKRSHDSNETSQQAKKPTVRPSSKPLSLQIEERRKREKAAAKEAKTAVKPVTNGVSSATVASKPKPATAAPKVSPFASLLSASKKPGTSLAERAAAAVTPFQSKQDSPILTEAILSETVKVESAKQPVTSLPVVSQAPSSTLSAASFLGFLADVDKPKVVPVKQPRVDSNESPETRAKRIRKEERRKLRVSWKADDELVQTRVFEHDIDEETGHDDSMMRDVGDSGKEGEMLKRHMSVDDESDEEEEEEEEFYFLPSEVSFDFPEGTMAYLKTGGTDMPESEATTAQNKYEEGKLMTMWSASRSQPPSPQEPSNDEDEEEERFEPCRDFGEPPQPTVRQREQSYLARVRTYQAPQLQQQPLPTQDLSTLLANIQAQTQAQSAPQDYQRNFDLLQHGQLPLPPPPPIPAFNGIDFNALLASQQVIRDPSTATLSALPPAIPQSMPTTAPTITPDIQALLANFVQSTTANTTWSQPTTSNNPNALPLGSGNKANLFPSSSTFPTDPDGQGKKEKKKGSKAPIDEKTGRPLNYKTQVCTYWLEGKCAKGDACTYKHERE